MFIKQFREQEVKVADPLRPGSYVFEKRMFPAGANSVLHENVEYLADEDGWFDVPQEVGENLLTNQGPWRFYTPTEVENEALIGRIKDDPEKVLTEAARPPKKAAAKKAAAKG